MTVNIQNLRETLSTHPRISVNPKYNKQEEIHRHYNEGAKTKIESLEATWKKWTITLNGTPIRLIADFSSEIMEMAVGWHIQSAQRKKNSI